MQKDKNYIIKKYIELGNYHKNDIAIVIVANVDGKTKQYDDYENASVLSEYYTLDEFETISQTYKKLGYEVFCFFSEESFMDSIINHKFTTQKSLLVINSAQTGTYIGRKSLIPAFCEYYKIMHTGSNPYIVSLCRDKFHTSTILNTVANYTLKTYLYNTGKWINDKRPTVGERIIIKLNCESASIGLTSDNIMDYAGEETDYYILNLAKKYNQPIVVQEFISGYEVELPIIISSSNTPLVPAGISYQGEAYIGNYILDYNTRFEHLYDFYNMNKYNSTLAAKLQIEAAKVAKVIGLEGFCRIDFRINKNEQYYISDIAYNPHITKDSSFAYIFDEMGYSYEEMFACLIGCAIDKYYKSLQ